jgi:hypothetical protein
LPTLTVAGLVALLLAALVLAATVVVWMIDPSDAEDSSVAASLPGRDSATAPRPDPQPPEELALPLPKDGEKEPAVRSIYVSAGLGGGWYLDVWSDRTTRLGYGAADTWRVKPNTFDFAATLKALRAVARKKDFPGGRHYRVSFRVEGVERSVQGYTQDSKLVLGLFDKAVVALENRNDRFEEIWKNNPPFKIDGK